MTLTVTIVNRFGAWQCSDHRMTDWPSGEIRDDASAKHLTLHCPDGSARINFAGAGIFYPPKRDPIHVSDWMREILRGENRTIRGHLDFLANAATRDLAPRLLEAKLGHYFLTAAFMAGSPWFFEIRNVEPVDRAPGLRVLPAFVTAHWQMTGDNAFVGGVGSGWEAMLAKDKVLLTKVFQKAPSDPEDFLRVLTKVNERTAAREPTVSPHCTATYLAPSGEGNQGLFHGDPAHPNPCITFPSITFGVDDTDTHRSTLEWARAAKSGQNDGLSAFMKSEPGVASPSSVTPRNRFREP